MRRAVLLVVFSCLLSAQTTLNPAQIEALERIAVQGIEQSRVPALSVAVSIGNAPVWTRAWGFSDLENLVPASPRAVFRLASISKTFTAVAALSLVENGKLDLDAEIQRYVAFPRQKWPVTTRQLLGHQSGIRHYRGDDFNSTRHYPSVVEALSIFAADPLLHEPGTAYLYSSYGFSLAGAVVERIAGMPYEAFVAQTVTAPAAMESTRPDDVYAIIPHRARGYRRLKDGSLENCALADTSNKLPGGGWASTAEDLTLFARALLDSKLLKPETRTLMWTPQKLKSGAPTSYGMGWTIMDVSGIRVVGHSGGQQGANTHLLIAPERSISIAVLANLEGAGAPAIALSMLKSLLQEKP